MPATHRLRPIEAVEAFHLAFLQVLYARLDPTRLVLKGGGNLRYFFGSRRYSEDIDLDAVDLEHQRLAMRIEKVLGSPVLRALLANIGISVGSINVYKNTPANNTWKFQLRVAGTSTPIPTKIEISHRSAFDPRTSFDTVPVSVIGPYAPPLFPFAITHYLPASAIEQKIGALAMRNETQARDIFDLDLLLLGWPGAAPKGRIPAETLDRAIDLMLRIPYATFRAKVMTFLEPQVQELYASEKTWEAMKERVLERLEELR
jgi:hypothetical protein